MQYEAGVLATRPRSSLSAIWMDILHIFYKKKFIYFSLTLLGSKAIFIS
jgi:hypothetical protein